MFSGWSSIFMFHRGPAQPALGRPQDRFSAACSCASCSCASCVLQGAARPPSLAELIFRLHSVACLSSLGPTVQHVFGFSRRRRESVCVGEARYVHFAKIQNCRKIGQAGRLQQKDTLPLGSKALQMSSAGSGPGAESSAAARARSHFAWMGCTRPSTQRQR